jgi:hypothetical protein
MDSDFGGYMENLASREAEDRAEEAILSMHEVRSTYACIVGNLFYIIFLTSPMPSLVWLLGRPLDLFIFAIEMETKHLGRLGSPTNSSSRKSLSALY